MAELRCTSSNLRKVLKQTRPGDTLFAITKGKGGARYVRTWTFRKIMGEANAGGSFTPDAVLKYENSVYTTDPCVVPDQRGPGIAHLPGQESDCCRRAEWKRYEKTTGMD